MEVFPYTQPDYFMFALEIGAGCENILSESQRGAGVTPIEMGSRIELLSCPCFNNFVDGEMSQKAHPDYAILDAHQLIVPLKN